jgi:uncharacterized membrane protein
MNFIQNIKNNYLLLGILFLAAILRFYHLDFQSVWLDEVITMKECNPRISFKESYDIMAIWENNPIIYYYLVKINSMVFGHSIFVVRAFSAVAGILTVYLFYLLGTEISNKRTGLYAAIIAAVNSYFIYYSQEARAYILLTLFTVFSFYKLVQFLKRNTMKDAIFYGLSLTLMINTHFFGLFVLVSQVVILFVFLFDIKLKKERITYIKNSAIAGIIAVSIWFIASWKIFKIASEIQAFWIPPPTPELLTGIFKEFFGASETLLFMVFILTVFYLINLFREKPDPDGIKSNTMIFSFAIISIWIFVTILIPFLRSYLKIPMITGRYIIVVLPAIVILLAIGLSKIKSDYVKNTLLTLFVVSSLIDLVVVKKYYTEIKKTQFREITAAIKEKNKQNDKIVSGWGWHFSYFFNTDAEPLKDVVVYKKLQDYVNELMSGQDRSAFWYVDGHFTEYKLSPEAEKFLAENYNLVENLAFFDSWAKYYVPKSSPENTLAFDINQFEPYKSDNGQNLLLFSNSTTKSMPTMLEPGDYRLAIKARSIPEQPLNGENAHLTLAVGGKKIGAYFLTEKEERTDYFQFTITEKKEYQLEITFDNDLVLDTADRNALIFSVVAEKIKKLRIK